VTKRTKAVGWVFSTADHEVVAEVPITDVMDAYVEFRKAHPAGEFTAWARHGSGYRTTKQLQAWLEERQETARRLEAERPFRPWRLARQGAELGLEELKDAPEAEEAREALRRYVVHCVMRLTQLGDPRMNGGDACGAALEELR
jgi:hypothetical protein